MVIVIDDNDITPSDRALIKSFLHENFNSQNKAAGIYGSLYAAMSQDERFSTYDAVKQTLTEEAAETDDPEAD